MPKWSDIFGALVPSNPNDFYKQARRSQDVMAIPTASQQSHQQMAKMMADHMTLFNAQAKRSQVEDAMRRRRGWLDLTKPCTLSDKKILTKMALFLQSEEPIPRISLYDWYAAFGEVYPETEDLVRINLGEIVSTGLDSCFAVKTHFIILIQSILPKDKDNE